MKQKARALLTLILSMALVSCGGKQPVSPLAEGNSASVQTQTINDPGDINSGIGTKLVKKPQKTRYLLSNGVEIKHTDISYDTREGDRTLPCPQVSGLVDKTLEARINRTIVEDVEKKVRSFTGKSNTEYFHLECTVQLNANNLLSISINNMYSPPVAGFLYRLTDGKRLYLKDIFTEGTDYVSLMNERTAVGILGGYLSEEELLREPFKSISEEQDFSLGKSSLFLIFHPGESGFVQSHTLDIPLSSIDDYVDVLDRYSGTERKNHERQELIIRENNIFIAEKGDVIKRKGENVWSHYPYISGLRDTAFEETVNKKIQDGLSEVINGKYLDGLQKIPDQFEDRIAVIEMQVTFNYYGFLCIKRHVYNDAYIKDLENLDAVYTFDLNKKKLIDAKSILSGYMAKNKGLQSSLTNIIKEQLASQYASTTSRSIDETGLDLDYSFILNKGSIYFSKYYQEDDLRLCIDFKPNTINGFSDVLRCTVPLKDIYTGAPEDFFGW